GVAFSNNLSKSGVGDRNLYVDEVTFDGVTNSTDTTFSMNMTKYWDFAL
ncbi:hypothetical protein JQC81_32500, partial [Microvirga arabica]|nr:hypothetical protein [Microvirga arabica]